MNIEMTGKDVKASKLLRERVEQKLGKIEQRLGEKLYVRVKLDSDSNHSFTCGIHFQCAGNDFNSTATSNDIIKSADEAMSKIERQVSKVQHRPEAYRNSSIRDQPSL